MTREPHFDIDRQWGERGEQTVREILALDAARIEVKRPRTGFQKVFIELEHKPRGHDFYVPSGLSVTTADFYAYTFGSAVVTWPTYALRQAVENQLDNPVDAGLRGDNPTRGYWISSHYLTQLAWEWGVQD